MNPLRPTIESLLEMDTDTLEKMTEAEVEKYLAEALRVCPVPVMPSGKAKGITDGLTKIPLSEVGGNKLAPRSKIGNALAKQGMSMEQMMALYKQVKENQGSK